MNLDFLRTVRTEDLQAELRRREMAPTWFIRGMVAEGHDIDTEDFRAATEWIDQRQIGEDQ